MQPTLVHVMGPSRAGTTMLGAMLDRSDEAFHCGEVYQRYRPRSTVHANLWCDCDDPCPVWDRFRDTPAERLHRAIADELGVRFVIDSSKQLSWVIDSRKWAMAQGMRVVHLVLWKDPDQLAYSLVKREAPIGDLPATFSRYFERCLASGLPFWSVSHTALSRDPAGTLAAICKVVEMPYEDRMVRFWEGPYHHLWGSLGTRRQMRRGEGRVDLTTLPEDFGKVASEVERMLSENPRMRRVRAALAARDVVSAAAGEAAPNGASRVRRPWWYWKERVESVVQRRWPREMVRPADAVGPGPWRDRSSAP